MSPFINRIGQASGNYPPTLIDNNNNNNNVYAPLSKNKKEKPKEALTTNLMQAVTTQIPQTNIIYSPLSLDLLLTFVTLGAKGKTAAQLEKLLKLPANKEQLLAEASRKIPQQQNAQGARIMMANKMYFDNTLEPQQNISNAAKSLQTDFEAVSFNQPGQAANNINNWVAMKTQNRIQNLINPNSLDGETQSILVNAIHFKAQWAKEFSTSDTEIRPFQNMDGQVVNVDMMYNEDVFPYGEFPNIGAKIIEMSYNDSDTAMMIILPDNVNGLSEVEKAMEHIDIADVAQQLKPMTVNLRLPRFRFECELDMVQPLMQLGIRELFSTTADLSGFFRNKLPKVSRVQTKAYLEVNEAGSEAAAASFYKLVPLSLPSKVTLFTVDHPFMFAIRSSHAVYFLGHVVKM